MEVLRFIFSIIGFSFSCISLFYFFVYDKSVNKLFYRPGYMKEVHKKEDPRKKSFLSHIIITHLCNNFDIEYQVLADVGVDIYETIVAKLEAGEIIEVSTGENFDRKQLKMHDYPPVKYFTYKDLIEHGDLPQETKEFYLNEIKKIQESL